MSRLSRFFTTLALLVAAGALTAGPALARKHDRDRLPDRWEKRHHLNVKKDDSRRDRDRDGLSNYGEYRAHTNPRKKDSDHDGRRDAREDYDRDHLRNRAEIRVGFDPGDADSDNDGTRDGRENAGTIAKLTNGSIRIKLAVGGSLTARLGGALAGDCSGGGGSGGVAQPGGEDAPDPDDGTDEPPAPGEDDNDPAEDPADAAEDAADDAETGDAPDERGSATAHASGEDDDEFDEAAFDQDFDEQAGGDAACGTTKLKVGAVIHKAHIQRTASGPVLVSIKLLRTRR